MNKIKPCPFCGAQAELDGWYKDFSSDTVFVICPYCKAQSAEFPCDMYNKESKQAASESAIEAWNRRYKEDDSKD